VRSGRKRSGHERRPNQLSCENEPAGPSAGFFDPKRVLVRSNAVDRQVAFLARQWSPLAGYDRRPASWFVSPCH
jgi:hypothetical protein